MLDHKGRNHLQTPYAFNILTAEWKFFREAFSSTYLKHYWCKEGMPTVVTTVKPDMGIPIGIWLIYVYQGISVFRVSHCLCLSDLPLINHAPERTLGHRYASWKWKLTCCLIVPYNWPQIRFGECYGCKITRRIREFIEFGPTTPSCADQYTTIDPCCKALRK